MWHFNRYLFSGLRWWHVNLQILNKISSTYFRSSFADYEMFCQNFRKKYSCSTLIFHSVWLLFLPGHVQRGRVPGKEPGHAAGRHRRGPEDLGEQTPAAAVFQPADQNRFVAIHPFECRLNTSCLLPAIETEKVFKGGELLRTMLRLFSFFFFRLHYCANCAGVSRFHSATQVSGFLKESARRHLLVPPRPPPTPHCWFQASVRRTGVNLHSPLSPERLSSLHGARSVFIFTKLSLLVSTLLNAICRLWELWDIFMIRFLNTQGDEGKVFREHKSRSRRLLSAG